MAYLKNTETIVGGGGLRPFFNTEEIELFVVVDPAFQQQQFGEEIAKACVEEGFRNDVMESFCIIVAQKNEPVKKMLRDYGIAESELIPAELFGVPFLGADITHEKYQQLLAFHATNKNSPTPPELQ